MQTEVMLFKDIRDVTRSLLKDTEVTCALVVASLLVPLSSAIAAPVLRAADIRIVITSPRSCDVTIALTIEGASEIDHRVDAGSIELVDVRGARQVGELRAIGRTQSLVLRPDETTYEFRYRAQQSEDRAHRCPIWLPAVSTDGQSRAVTLHVELPPATTPGGSMPALAWAGTRGSATLGHLPSFVHVPFGPEGEAPGWGIGPVMDAVALTMFGGASVLWLWRRKR